MTETKTSSPGPVHTWKGQWYFWDETWTERLGPFVSEAEARAQLLHYVTYLDRGPKE